MAFNILPKFKLLDWHDMGQTFTSDPCPCNGQDNIGIELQWAGTPTGTFTVQVSNSYWPGDATSPYNAGVWNTLTLSSTISAAGSSDSAAINLNQLPFSWYRIKYTYSSGSGLVTAIVTQKGI